jgi:hypothetical protein
VPRPSTRTWRSCADPSGAPPRRGARPGVSARSWRAARAFP